MPIYRHHEVDGVPIVHRSDPKNSISAWMGLTRHEGRLAAVVESTSAKHQISALLDLIDLHLSGGGSPEGVALLLEAPHPEAAAALETLKASITEDVPVHILEYAADQWVPVRPPSFHVATADPHYPRWSGLLGADFAVPVAVSNLITEVGLPEVRAYPQLTAKGEWSIRVEGLQVGRVLATGTGWLDVGKLGKLGATGPERATWLRVWPDGKFTFDTGTLVEAAGKIREFADLWKVKAGGEQNEHVLESRILRGCVEVRVDGRPLGLIRDNDGVVNWGSQFPTKWGPGRSARYLDALMRDPTDSKVPWAVEMKVRVGGEGQYYRHAVAQAVLYRHFIRKAEALHFWFKPYGLDAALCEAAVVVPEFKSAVWKGRHTALCRAFNVALVTVPDADTVR